MSGELGDPQLTEAEAIALVLAYEINEFPTHLIDGRDANEVLDEAEAKLERLLPAGYEDRFSRSMEHEGKSIASLQDELNDLWRKQRVR